MEVLIGREAASSRLSVLVDQKAKVFGEEGSVPTSVSRKHCSITVDEETGKMHIKNLKSDNVTMVNGMAVESLTIHENDKIELGRGLYNLDWNILRRVIKIKKPAQPKEEKEVDIRHLETLWKSYEQQTASIAFSEKMTNVLRGGIPILTIGVAAAGFVLKDKMKEHVALIVSIYVVVVSILIFLFVKSIVDAKKIPKKRDRLKKAMIKKYTCECGYCFNFTPYDIVRSNYDYCPKCKSKLIK